MFFSINFNRSQRIGNGRHVNPSMVARLIHPTACLAIVLTIPLLEGCNSAESDAQTAGILLTSEPEGVQTVLEVREALLGTVAVEHLHAGHGHDEHGHDEHGHDEHGHDDDNHEHGHEAESAHEHVEHNGNNHDQEHEQGHESEQAHDHDGHDHDNTSTQPQKPAEAVGPAGPIEVVVVGKIGGLTNPWQQTEPDFPFVKGAAKFFLADPGAVAEQQADGHQHAPGEECAFCAAHDQDSSALLAIVQFKDKQGKILRRDARQWLTLKGNETVVVHGQARIIAGGLLVVDADSLYVRR